MLINRPSIFNGVPIPYGATVEELKQRMDEPGPTAWAAFVALGGTPGTDALRLLSNHARSDDWRYRRIAVESISRHARALEAAEVLVNALEDANTYVVITGCKAVADHHLSQAHTRITSLLSHAESPVREAAVAAIGAIWDAGDFARVKQLHTSDSSSEVRKRAAWTLMGSVGESTWRDLYALWQASPVGRYRLWAVQLARQFGGEEASELMKGFQSDPDGHVRKAAALTRMA